MWRTFEQSKKKKHFPLYGTFVQWKVSSEPLMPIKKKKNYKFWSFSQTKLSYNLKYSTLVIWTHFRCHFGDSSKHPFHEFVATWRWVNDNKSKFPPLCSRNEMCIITSRHWGQTVRSREISSGCQETLECHTQSTLHTDHHWRFVPIARWAD